MHLAHLRARMEQTGQTGHWKAGEPLTLDALRRRLSERFAAIDFDAARAAVRPFIRAADELALWGRAFFDGLLPRLMAETKSKVNPVE